MNLTQNENSADYWRSTCTVSALHAWQMDDVDDGNLSAHSSALNASVSSRPESQVSVNTDVILVH